MATAKLNPRIIAPIVILTALGLGGWYLDSQRAKSRATLSGFFETQPIEVASRQAGRVMAIYVREGDRVRAGQTMVELEAAGAQADLQSKRLAAAEALAQYRDVAAGSRPEEIARQEAAVQEMTQNLQKLRNSPRPQEVAAANAAEKAARARLAATLRGPTTEEKAEARDRLDAAMAQETLADAEAVRYKSLYAKDAVTGQQLDQVVANQRAAAARRRELQAAYTRAVAGTPREERVEARESYRQVRAQQELVLAGSRKEDVAAAVDRLRQAEAVLSELRHGERPERVQAALAAANAARAAADAAAKTLAERVVRAPRDAVVDRVLVAAGDLVPAGATVIRMLNPNDLWIRIYVPEAQIAHVAVGDRAQLVVDGISEPVTAVVDNIATQGEFTPVNLQTPDERGKQVFAIRLRLERPDPRVKPGMFANVDRLGRLP